MPRDTLVLFWDDEPGVALAALPTGGHGRLWAGDTLSWRLLDDGTAELQSGAADLPVERWTTERCVTAEADVLF